MPEMDGLELYRKIRLLDKNIDICFLTAVNDFSEYRMLHPDIINEIEKDKDSCIIDKPADTEQLIERINKVIYSRIRQQNEVIGSANKKF